MINVFYPSGNGCSPDPNERTMRAYLPGLTGVRTSKWCPFSWF